MDIMTAVPQICGRIRDSEFKSEVVQYYATSPYKDVSMEEHRASIEKHLREAEVNAIQFSGITGDTRERLEKYFINREPYIAVINHQIVVDRNMAKLEIANYNIVNGQYACQYMMQGSLQTAGFVVETKRMQLLEEHNRTLTIKKTAFRDLFEEYVALRQAKLNLSFRREHIEEAEPIVKEAYEKLGPEKVREMKYHTSNIRRELIKVEHEKADIKAYMLFDQLVKQGVPFAKS